jgi:hypothetical protein
MNEKTAKKIRKAVKGNKTVYRLIKRRWTQMPITMKFKKRNDLHADSTQG